MTHLTKKQVISEVKGIEQINEEYLNNPKLHFGKLTSSDASLVIETRILSPRSLTKRDDFLGTVTDLVRNYKPEFKASARIKSALIGAVKR